MSPSPRVPDLAALELLISVGRLGSFGKAAREHGVTQPAVSSRIQHLERRLGMPLVQRSTTGCRLTPEGAMVVDWARSLLTAAEHLDAGIAALRRSREGRLRVAASLTVAEYLVPGWLIAFSYDHKDVEVSLAVGNSVEVARQLTGDEADLGFVEAPDVPASLSARRIGGDHLDVVVSADHPWARRRKPLDPAELAATPLVQREEGSGTRDTYDRALTRLGLVSVAPAVVLSSTTAIKQAVQYGAGPAVLSSLALADDIAAGRLVAVSCDQLDLRRSLSAVWPRGRQLVGAAGDLVGVAVRRGVPA